MDAFRTFMDGLIDYAGLFPPASCDMPAAVQEYARLRGQPEAWMLGRFIVPAGRLAELAGCLAQQIPGPDAPWRLAVIVNGDGREVAAIVEAMRRVVEEAEGRLVIETIETRVASSAPASDDAGALRQLVSGLETSLAAAGFAGLPIYFEAAGAEERLLAALGPADAPRRNGLKLRCGGPRPEDVPSAARVAQVIADCAAKSAPLKLTAGLHHPLRRVVSPSGDWQHGFLNVVGAGVLFACGRLDHAGLVACLQEEKAARFRFDGRFAWGDHGAAPAEIGVARRGLMVGFGSCSFREPLDDLRALGLMG